MNIWRSQYTLRRFAPQKRKRGYTTRSYTDTTVKLNVQPVSASTEKTPEGKRVPKRIKAFGLFPIATEDVKTGKQADRLFYNGCWYQCESSLYWEHTPLAHYETEFTLISEAVSESDVASPSRLENDGKVDGEYE